MKIPEFRAILSDGINDIVIKDQMINEEYLKNLFPQLFENKEVGTYNIYDVRLNAKIFPNNSGFFMLEHEHNYIFRIEGDLVNDTVHKENKGDLNNKRHLMKKMKNISMDREYIKRNKEKNLFYREHDLKYKSRYSALLRQYDSDLTLIDRDMSHNTYGRPERKKFDSIEKRKKKYNYIRRSSNISRGSSENFSNNNTSSNRSSYGFDDVSEYSTSMENEYNSNSRNSVDNYHSMENENNFSSSSSNEKNDINPQEVYRIYRSNFNNVNSNTSSTSSTSSISRNTDSSNTDSRYSNTSSSGNENNKIIENNISESNKIKNNNIDANPSMNPTNNNTNNLNNNINFLGSSLAHKLREIEDKYKQFSILEFKNRNKAEFPKPKKRRSKSMHLDDDENFDIQILNHMMNAREKKYLIAIDNYAAMKESEMDLNKGDKIIFIETDESGWTKGSNGGKSGWFPSSCVEDYKPEKSENFNKFSEYIKNKQLKKSNKKSKKFSTHPFEEKKKNKLFSKKKNMYGVSINKLFDKTGQEVPFPLQFFVSLMDCKEMLEAEGIFRIPGTGTVVSKIKEKFLLGRCEGINISEIKFSPHDIASALKQFFDELPKPFLNEELLYKMSSCFKDFPEHSAFNPSMQILLTSIPKLESLILHFTLQFLHHITEYSEKNKMNSTNLGSIFGPLFFRVYENISYIKPSQIIVENLIHNVNEYKFNIK